MESCLRNIWIWLLTARELSLVWLLALPHTWRTMLQSCKQILLLISQKGKTRLICFIGKVGQTTSASVLCWVLVVVERSSDPPEKLGKRTILIWNVCVRYPPFSLALVSCKPRWRHLPLFSHLYWCQTPSLTGYIRIISCLHFLILLPFPFTFNPDSCSSCVSPYSILSPVCGSIHCSGQTQLTALLAVEMKIRDQRNLVLW